jgi:hypothetical protein
MLKDLARPLLYVRLATPIQAFARFQAGLLSSEDLSYSIDFHRLSWIAGWLAAQLAS